MWSVRSGGGGGEGGVRDFKGAGGRGGFRGWVMGSPLPLNAAALALRGAQLVLRGTAGGRVALKAAAGGGIVGHGGLGGGGRMGRNRSRPWASRRSP